MKESQAWALLADVWKNRIKIDPRGFAYVLIDGSSWEHGGICSCINDLATLGRIDMRTRNSMAKIIRERKGKLNIIGYHWPCTVHGAIQRAKFCRSQSKA